MSKELLNYTQNRELSWLKFNQRVLEEAQDESVPLLERMKFVAIFTSNLDEFFMIRVGSLYDMVHTDAKAKDSRSGMTAQEQIQAILEEVAPLYKERDKTYSEIKKELHPYGVCGLDYKELEPQEKKYVKHYFKNQILPILSPQIVDANHPFPHLLNKELYVTASLKMDNKSMMGIVPVPQFVSDILCLPGHDIRYIRMEKVILEHLNLVFPKYEVSEANYICVTRNADVSPDDEALEVTDDFRYLMQQTIHKRRRMAVVRLETANKLSEETQKYFCEKFEIEPNQIFRTKMPMKLDYIFGISGNLPEAMKRSLTYTPFSPQNSGHVAAGNVMRQIKKKDILLFYPYESMDPFLRLIKEASVNPDVMTIKITIYRLAKKARLVEYLCAAAENGKEVVVLVELRARFDEESNIEYSRKLEEAGCRVIYGLNGYKVHSKLCLISRKTDKGVSYITQIGTGNYNEKTSALYTDLSLITANQEIGKEAAEVFAALLKGEVVEKSNLLLVAPKCLQNRVLDMIQEEIDQVKQGNEGYIGIKINSLTDKVIINKLVEASQAGVKIEMVVRGICCLIPEIKGYTENIKVISIVGRYLEHSRIYRFGTKKREKIYIASADFMTRNTVRRVEVAAPVLNEKLKERLDWMFETMMNDDEKGKRLTETGNYADRSLNDVKLNSQEIFYAMAYSNAEKTQKKRED